MMLIAGKGNVFGNPMNPQALRQSQDWWTNMSSERCTEPL
jgi:hypothetical protein